MNIDDLHEAAAEAIYRAGIELAATAVTGTAHALVIGAAAEARHRGVALDEVVMGRTELTMALAEIRRRHTDEGTPSAADIASRLDNPDVWECVQLRARNIMILRGIEDGWFAFPQGGAA